MVDGSTVPRSDTDTGLGSSSGAPSYTFEPKLRASDESYLTGDLPGRDIGRVMEAVVEGGNQDVREQLADLRADLGIGETGLMGDFIPMNMIETRGLFDILHFRLDFNSMALYRDDYGNNHFLWGASRGDEGVVTGLTFEPLIPDSEQATPNKDRRGFLLAAKQRIAGIRAGFLTRNSES